MTPKEYELALKRIEELMESSAELGSLIARVDKYEKKMWPITEDE